MLALLPVSEFKLLERLPKQGGDEVLPPAMSTPQPTFVGFFVSAAKRALACGGGALLRRLERTSEAEEGVTDAGNQGGYRTPRFNRLNVEIPIFTLSVRQRCRTKLTGYAGVK